MYRRSVWPTVLHTVCIHRRSHLRRAIAAIKDRVEAVDLASHGFMSRMLDIILSIFEKCLENQMNSIY